MNWIGIKKDVAAVINSKTRQVHYLQDFEYILRRDVQRNPFCHRYKDFQISLVSS